jgi:hypothetical protein
MQQVWTYHLMAEDGVSHGPMVHMKQLFGIMKVATRDDCLKQNLCRKINI